MTHCINVTTHDNMGMSSYHHNTTIEENLPKIVKEVKENNVFKSRNASNPPIPLKLYKTSIFFHRKHGYNRKK